MKFVLLGIGMMLIAAAPAMAASDADALTSRVTAALASAGDVPEQDITVSTHAGTVVLTGFVGSDAERERALQVAEQAAQDTRVSSHLQIRPQVQAEQQAALRLVRAVELALQRDARTAQIGVAVSIDDEGVIGLHGLVSSAESRALAEQVAARVEGVSRLRNHLLTPGETNSAGD